MIELSPAELAIVSKILAEHVPHCEVRAFGSRVNGNSRKYSDLDIAIVGNEKLDIMLLYQMEEAFQDSLLPFSVDILDWHAISSNFRQLIQAQYEIIQEKAV